MQFLGELPWWCTLDCVCNPTSQLSLPLACHSLLRKTTWPTRTLFSFTNWAQIARYVATLSLACSPIGRDIGAGCYAGTVEFLVITGPMRGLSGTTTNTPTTTNKPGECVQGQPDIDRARWRLGMCNLTTSYTWFMNAQFFSHLGYNMLLSLPQTLTLWGHFLLNKITCRFSKLSWIVLTSSNFDFVFSSICDQTCWLAKAL